MRTLYSTLLLLAACASPPPAEPVFNGAEVDAFQTRVETEICRLSQECDLALNLPADADACAMVAGTGLWPSGRAHRLDAPEADACLDALGSFTCAEAQRDRASAFEGFIRGRCFSAVVGAAAENEACYATGECEEGLFCAGFRNPDLPEGPCPGRCERIDGTQTCFGGTAECNTATERCSADGLACVPIGEAGDACSLGTCGAFLQCIAGTCVTRSAESEECGERRCALGLLCSTESGLCTPPEFGRGLDEPCDEGDFCARGLFCNGSRCLREAALGEECADLVRDVPQRPCAPDLYCRAEPGSVGTCQPRGNPGDVCTALEVRSGTHQPSCYGVCIDGVCVESGDEPRLCERG